jgi:beta-lactamase class A
MRRAVLIACFVVGSCWAQAPLVELLEGRMRDRIEDLQKRTSGVLGVYAVDLKTGRTFGVNANTQFAQASSIKIPILIELFRQVELKKFKWTDEIRLEAADLTGGSGNLQKQLKNGPVTITLRELAVTMMRDSDNTSTNKLIAMLGMEQVQKLINSYGLKTVKLQRKMIDTVASSADRENIGAPAEMAEFLVRIAKGDAVSAQASKEMIEILKLVPGDVRKVVPQGIGVAAKTGGLTGVRTETAYVMLEQRPYVVSIAAVYLADKEEPLEELARIVHDHFTKLDRSNSYGNRVRN